MPACSLDVLVVDPDESTRAALRGVVVALGHRCRVAADGFDALHAHQAQPADVIVSGWTMPGMDGMELCRRVRALDRGTYTYLLFMSGHARKRDFVDAVRAGADDYLSKPVDVDALEARLIAADRVVRAYRTLAQNNIELRHDNEVSFRAARVDSLTGIANRLRLEEDLHVLQAQVSRYGRRACVAMCDLDAFKKYNDHYGHLAGDDALRRIARTIRAKVRRADVAYRYGGEEFLVVLQEQAIEEAVAAMQRVRAAVVEIGIAHAPGVQRSVLTVSIGLAPVEPRGGESVREAIACADRALYRAKAAGGDCVEARPSPAGSAARETDVATDAHGA